ncbi:D-alanyl-D-alanine carboxypeptidase family protein [Pseudonocardia hierapolitana]|uniref:D-alanyl-D-alanine carboxypeptidase family protein n=1 Tax=Pseudonocardia hierapolitana TaxID=1128676 RepID=UPI001FEC7000|nr:D-alanyl-D-alanine carboxypeptidase family protein [Pseudonocardia hierapolitana]
MPTAHATRTRDAVIGMLMASVCGAVAALGVLGATGRVVLVWDRVVGRPLAIVEEMPGPETGPDCPLDARYVDEPPDRMPPDTLAAWQRLRTAAGGDGVQLCLNDGKRSREQQARQFADAVQQFGSAELASKYVLQPDESMHVVGIAVDIQPLASAGWVERNGAALGWCRRYENEPWHFEYDLAYATSGCPALLPSATGS